MSPPCRHRSVLRRCFHRRRMLLWIPPRQLSWQSCCRTCRTPGCCPWLAVRSPRRRCRERGHRPRRSAGVDGGGDGGGKGRGGPGRRESTAARGVASPGVPPRDRFGRSPHRRAPSERFYDPPPAAPRPQSTRAGAGGGAWAPRGGRGRGAEKKKSRNTTVCPPHPSPHGPGFRRAARTCLSSASGLHFTATSSLL